MAIDKSRTINKSLKILEKIDEIAMELKGMEKLKPTSNLPASFGNAIAMANQYGRQLANRVEELRLNLEGLR